MRSGWDFDAVKSPMPFAVRACGANKPSKPAPRIFRDRAGRPTRFERSRPFSDDAGRAEAFRLLLGDCGNRESPRPLRPKLVDQPRRLPEAVAKNPGLPARRATFAQRLDVPSRERVSSPVRLRGGHCPSCPAPPMRDERAFQV